jgi:hypothetical protein
MFCPPVGGYRTNFESMLFFACVVCTTAVPYLRRNKSTRQAVHVNVPLLFYMYLLGTCRNSEIALARKLRVQKRRIELADKR